MVTTAPYGVNRSSIPSSNHAQFTNRQQFWPQPASTSASQYQDHALSRPTFYSHSNASAEITGYLKGYGTAGHYSMGEDLERILLTRGIDLEENPPFAAVTGKTTYLEYGVIKINNIPFTVNAQEIVQFVSRYSVTPMIRKNVDGYPIHVIMEKPTGKTMDCFVEFPTLQAAEECIHRFEYTSYPGRLTRLGTRCVSMDLSSQAELMKQIFPRARLVKFDARSGKPTILQNSDNSWSEGFRGYFTLEEMHGITKFAENPSRSPFVLKCHQRVYESLISTLYKFPWPATSTYTVAARNALFEAAHKQLVVLTRKVCPPTPSATSPEVDIKRNRSVTSHSTDDLCQYDQDWESPRFDYREVGLSNGLLLDLIFASINAPGFSLLQKRAICQAAGVYGQGITLGPFGDAWPFQTFEPSTGTPQHVVKFWLELFDTGFDLMTSARQPTTFEHYLVFCRNRVGFPIAEWTRAGADLPFEDAIRVEKAVVLQYVSRARQVWAQERQIQVSRWQTTTLKELMEEIFREKQKAQRAEEARLVQSQDGEISPRSSAVLNFEESLIEDSDPLDPTVSSSKLNAATALDFIPSLLLVHPRLTVNTNIANDTSAPAFQNPFASASSRDRLNSSCSNSLSGTTAADISPFARTPTSGAQSNVAEQFRKLSFTTPKLTQPARRGAIQAADTPVDEAQDGSVTSEDIVRTIIEFDPHDDPFIARTSQRTQTLPNLYPADVLPSSTLSASNRTASIQNDFGPIGSTRPGSMAIPSTYAGGATPTETWPRAQSIPIATRPTNHSYHQRTQKERHIPAHPQDHKNNLGGYRGM